MAMAMAERHRPVRKMLCRLQASGWARQQKPSTDCSCCHAAPVAPTAPAGAAWRAAAHLVADFCQLRGGRAVAHVVVTHARVDD